MANSRSRRGRHVKSPCKPQPPILKLGTLPEPIGETDLSTLNSALGLLFGRLREARVEFDQEGEGGRGGIKNALGACWTFITLLKTPLAESLHVPILRLHEALAMLGQGRTEPMLKAVRRRGRAPSGPAYVGLKGHAVATVQLLILHAGLARDDAHRAVATLLSRFVYDRNGARGLLRLPPCETGAMKPQGTSVGMTAAMMYDYKLAHGQEMLSALPKDQARQRALQELAGWVQLIFPELRKPS